MAYPVINERDGEHRVVSTDEARQGESTGHVRYVLYASLGLAVTAGLALFVAFSG